MNNFFETSVMSLLTIIMFTPTIYSVQALMGVQDVFKCLCAHKIAEKQTTELL